MNPDRTFRSTAAAGRDFTSPPMRPWQRAKKLGVQDARDIDLARDIGD
ncbi:MAG: hypothetical protein ACM3O7_07310 [Acidobacteriota bacterium]